VYYAMMREIERGAERLKREGRLLVEIRRTGTLVSRSCVLGDPPPSERTRPPQSSCWREVR
jgi:hypothetical protein